MIFKPELIDKILAGEKTVTRRPVKYKRLASTCADAACQSATVELRCKYRAGGFYAVQPVIEEGPGKGRGGKGVARIWVLNVTREALGGGLDWSLSEAQREGFEDWPAFAEYWKRLYGDYDPTQLVHRIEFELVGAAT